MTVNDKIIKNKLGLLNLAQELGNVSKACQVMGFSRDTFYRYKSAVEEGGVENLMDQCRRKPNLKNRIDPNLEERIVKIALENCGRQSKSAAGRGQDSDSRKVRHHAKKGACMPIWNNGMT